MSSRLEAQQQAIQAKDETITQLMEMIQSNKGLESKQLEMHKEQHNADKKKLAEALNQLVKLREEIDERDRAISSLREVMVHVLKNLLIINCPLFCLCYSMTLLHSVIKLIHVHNEGNLQL